MAIKNNKLVLKGTRNPNDKLWDIPIQKQSITPYNYVLPPIHPAIYSKANAVTEINVCNSNFRYPQRLDRKTTEKQSLLYELKLFSDIIEHNILDNAISKASPVIHTGEAVDTNITAARATFNKIPPHPNEFTWQPPCHLTDITYVNKYYNARRLSAPENSQPQAADVIKARIEPSNPSLSVIMFIPS